MGELIRTACERQFGIASQEDCLEAVRALAGLSLPVGTPRAMDEHQSIMARDALHAAVVSVHALEGICSYDRDFDRIKSLKRSEP